MCVRNSQYSDLNDLPFYGDQRFINRGQIYCINDDIVETLNNGSIIYVYTNWIKEEYIFSLMYPSIDDRNNACDHRNIEIEYLHFGWDLRMIAQQ